MKKTILFLILAAICASTFVYNSCDARLIGLTVTPTKHDYSNVNIGDSAEFIFTITNISTTPIRITNFNVMGMPSYTISVGDTPKTLTGNQVHRITVKFEPTTAGPQQATVQIFHDGPGKTRTIALSGIGVPVPRIQMSETSYDFGTVGIGLTVDHDFEIENVGTADMVLSFFNFTGNPTLFSITAGGAAPVTITPGSTHTVTVQYAPTSVGDFPTVLEIAHNAVNEVPPAKITISAKGGGGRIVVNQNSPWDFGQAAIGMGGKTDEIEISNTGSVDLNIQNLLIITGTAYSITKIENSSGNPVTTPFAIAGLDFVKVTIEFLPTAVNNYNDTFSIEHDGSYSASPMDIPLIGTGRNLIKQTFNYTGSAQNWNVPAGATKIKVDCWGAEGGQYPGHGLGGKGGKATAGVPVAPGTTINVYVGQKAMTLNGGWNGGGTGCVACTGAGGGGASDIRIGGSSLGDRKVVAGGGGGGGYNFPGYGQVTGGDGGGLNGDRGTSGYGPGPGGGGTQTAGGTGGGSGATNGALGVGGNGVGRACGGGGGGGGYYGGGGSYCDGGGGGSSYYDAVGNTDKSTTKGLRQGDGQVELSY